MSTSTGIEFDILLKLEELEARLAAVEEVAHMADQTSLHHYHKPDR